MNAIQDSLRFYAATDVGRVRNHNEDNFLVDKKLGLFVVCDGMGGHAAGEVASAIAVRTLHEELRKERETLGRYASSVDGGVAAKDVLSILERAVQTACAKIHQEARVDAKKRGMGTTLSAMLLLGHQGFIAHVGDSRIYLLRGGRVQQVTEDHTVFNELVKRGRLTREQIEQVAQKNAITRAVGVYEQVEVDTLVLEVLPGDAFALMSDGLAGYLEGEVELANFLSGDGDQAVKSLVQLANDRGGKDNITVVVLRLGDGGTLDDTRARRLALKREALVKMPIFGRLTERELLRVMQMVEVRAYADGQCVIREGDKGDELFIVLQGQVKVTRGEATLSVLGPGENFGEMALIRSVPRSATVFAVGPAELIALRRPDFFEILRKEHEIAVKMLWQFLGVLADRLDQTSSELRQARAAFDDMSTEIFPEVEAPSASRSFDGQG